MTTGYQMVPSTEVLPWDRLRKEARNLEQQIDAKLILLSQMALNSDNKELVGLLEQLDSITKQMQVHVERNPQQFTHLYSRHVANLYEYNREFDKSKEKRIEYSTSTSTYHQQQLRMEQNHDQVDEILQYDRILD